MNIKDALSISSLKSGTLMAGKAGIDREIKGVMVLEASDIENWGTEGQMILTSFYALKDLNVSQLDGFFGKLHKIGISCLVIKVDRLLSTIPKLVIEYCDKLAIPLIQIPNAVKYESVILEILSPIVDKNIDLLNRYYEVHNILNTLALTEPTMHQIIAELKSMINFDISLVNKTKNKVYTTKPSCDLFEITSTSPVPKSRYMNFQYFRSEVSYTAMPKIPLGTVLTVSIPSLGKQLYDLIIHEIDNTVKSDDFMVIENIVSYLQMELLKQYSISQNQFYRNNNLVNDLINGKVYNPIELDDVLSTLSIDKYPLYQMLQIRISIPQSITSDDVQSTDDLLKLIRRAIKRHYRNTVFLERNKRISFILNFSNQCDSFASEVLKDIMTEIKTKSSYTDFDYQISISTQAFKSELVRINNEILDIQKILNKFHIPDKILSYEDLGIYKIFIDSNNLDSIEQYISPKICEFNRDYPELMRTLEIFLKTNQNFSETSKLMFFHPKTIRYRIDKIIEILGLDFNDSEQLFHIQIASRLFKLIS